MIQNYLISLGSVGRFLVQHLENTAHKMEKTTSLVNNMKLNVQSAKQRITTKIGGRTKMELNIETIKALDPGKVYVIAIDFSKCVDFDFVDPLLEIGRRYNIAFLFLDKDNMEIISVPEGYEIVKK